MYSIIERYGARYGFEAALGATTTRQVSGRTYRSHVLTVKAPGAASVTVTQHKTDDSEGLPLTGAQTAEDTWQFRTLDEIEGARQGAARVRIIALNAEGTATHNPALGGRPRKVGKSTTLNIGVAPLAPATDNGTTGNGNGTNGTTDNGTGSTGVVGNPEDDTIVDIISDGDDLTVNLDGTTLVDTSLIATDDTTIPVGTAPIPEEPGSRWSRMTQTERTLVVVGGAAAAIGAAWAGNQWWQSRS